MIPYCIVIRDSTKACEVVDNWIGHRLWKLNEALSQYDLGRYAKKGAIAPVEDAIEGAIAPVEDAIETPPPQTSQRPSDSNNLQCLRLVRLIVLCFFLVLIFSNLFQIMVHYSKY